MTDDGQLESSVQTANDTDMPPRIESNEYENRSMGGVDGDLG
jgi:hypothetical protein